MGSFWDALSGKIYHWNITENALATEVWGRLDGMKPADPARAWFHRWYRSFFVTVHAFLQQAFEEKAPYDQFFRDRFKAYSKETFKYVHAVCLAHHLHAIRESLHHNVEGILSDAGHILDLSQTAIRDLLLGYEDKTDGAAIGLRTWRALCQTLGVDATQYILESVVWIERIAASARIADEEAGRCAK